jgi:ferredoxin
MPFVVTDSCIRCKYMDCVSVCPVSCFYEGQTMLVIRQSDCIDCGICEPECPVEAIVPDSHPRAAMWIELNEKYSEAWPNITEHRDPPSDADHFKTVPNKYPRYFSPLPGD